MEPMINGNETPLPIRVGIMGAARIARKNIAAIQNHVSNCKIVAIASRSIEKADDLRQHHVLEELHDQIIIIAGDNAYERLLKCDEIDAVYIPLPVT